MSQCQAAKLSYSIVAENGFKCLCFHGHCRFELVIFLRVPGRRKQKITPRVQLREENNVRNIPQEIQTTNFTLQAS